MHTFWGWCLYIFITVEKVLHTSFTNRSTNEHEQCESWLNEIGFSKMKAADTHVFIAMRFCLVTVTKWTFRRDPVTQGMCNLHFSTAHTAAHKRIFSKLNFVSFLQIVCRVFRLCAFKMCAHCTQPIRYLHTFHQRVTHFTAVSHCQDYQMTCTKHWNQHTSRRAKMSFRIVLEMSICAVAFEIRQNADIRCVVDALHELFSVVLLFVCLA